MSAAVASHPLEDRDALQALLQDWVAHGWLRRLDRAFAAFLQREAPDAEPLLILAAALASHQLGRGQACLDLEQSLLDPTAALSLPPDEDGRPSSVSPETLLAGLGLERWLDALDCEALVGHGEGVTPLVLEGSRLYLRRYWQYEQDVRQAISGRLERVEPAQPPALQALLRHALDVLFPSSGAGTDWQRVACALASRKPFSIITGGPGTGKTTTVVRLMALLQVLAHEQGGGEGLRIRLAAPTGKAAARLAESIAGAMDGLPFDRLPHGERVRSQMPLEVRTLHRLLGSRPDTRHLRHDAANPLALDVLVIDEASMVDLEMLAAVMAALPDHARVVLLGDKDQLASVEAGAAFGALCRRAAEVHYTPATCEWLRTSADVRIDATFVDPAGSPMDQAVTMLRHSHRFGADSGIGHLARAVNAGDATRVLAVLEAGYDDIAHVRLAGGRDPVLERVVVGREDSGRGEADGYRHYLEIVQLAGPPTDAPQQAFDEWARRVLAAQRRFQVLCALRRGPCGVEGLNARIAQWLERQGWIDACEGWYAGRPVLVTRNDHALGLMNGDVGITLMLPAGRQGAKHSAGLLRVAFPAGDGSDRVRWLLPARLPDIETVFAMTVHKSQGSEFGHVALILPERVNPGLTRELLYTGLTRASRCLTLVSSGEEPVLAQAIARRTVNASGLMPCF